MHYSTNTSASTTTLRTRRTFGLWGIRMLEAAGHGRSCSELLASSGDNSATAIGKALAAPVARLSGDANGCLHYPPADA